MRELILKRVKYGKKETLPQDREYNVEGAGPVGTLSEWIEFAEDFGSIVVIDEIMDENYKINLIN